MNKWECQAPGCKNSAVGCGGAIGLRAIGWHFTRGPRILCPAHRPDTLPCTERENSHQCELCAAEHEAKKIQKAIRAGWIPGVEPEKGS